MDDILQGISPNWLNIIYSGKTKSTLDYIYNKLKDKKNVTPNQKDWFNWCRYTELSDVHVIILGQDPYHKEGCAHGLSFSCLKGIPPSLRNIYKCLIKNQCISGMPTHGNLTSWSDQGVLLLNSSLSTMVGNAGSHMTLWKPYIDLVIQNIGKYHYDNNKQLIFLLWGSFAQSFINIIDDDYHICLTSIHPSPLAQNTTDEKKFINCNHFTFINEYLNRDGFKINWLPTDVKSSNKEINIKNNYTTDNKENSIKTTTKKNFDSFDEILDIGQHHHISFTDGSCYPNIKNNSARGGYSAIFVSGPYVDKCVYGNLNITIHNASNIRAEGMAIIRTLELVKECKHPWKKLTIISDCKFWIDMIENYMPKWKKEKFKEKANPDLTTRMWIVYNEVKEKGDIILLHMKSHGKDGWQHYADGTFERFCFTQNDYADKMCGHARKKMQPSSEIFEDISYE